ncbi:hypothetical protein JOE65_000640 [Arthrobacter roseus]|nr:hypothetical protein [Arthrobacter roseus]
MRRRPRVEERPLLVRPAGVVCATVPAPVDHTRTRLLPTRLINPPIKGAVTAMARAVAVSTRRLNTSGCPVLAKCALMAGNVGEIVAPAMTVNVLARRRDQVSVRGGSATVRGVLGSVIPRTLELQH